MTKTKSLWPLYTDSTKQIPKKKRKSWLDNPPPWRRLYDVNAKNLVKRDATKQIDQKVIRRGKTYVPSGPDEVNSVNLALLLRRPLLVTGDPGVGKTTLAYRIAWLLDLGEPLRWEINSQTTLDDGLYAYDAISHLQSIKWEQNYEENSDEDPPDTSMGTYITLGPLGTALLPYQVPRVLLIDELDKANFDLPNDLLHVFEEGSFTIKELLRLKGPHRVYPFDSKHSDDIVTLPNGMIRTNHHPVVIITSNNERNFPPAFMRRCVPLHLEQPKDHKIKKNILLSQFEASLDVEHLTTKEKQKVRKDFEVKMAHIIKNFDDQMTDVLMKALFLHYKFGADLSEFESFIKRK